MATSYHYMLIGALVVACGAVAVFFLRFARDTRDRLFACFGGAFFVLSAHWLLLGVIRPASEFRPFLYLLRLAAFLLILVGIALKNRP
jgi:drug/metabolite transporter superfamily protein YnfA